MYEWMNQRRPKEKARTKSLHPNDFFFSLFFMHSFLGRFFVFSFVLCVHWPWHWPGTQYWMPEILYNFFPIPKHSFHFLISIIIFFIIMLFLKCVTISFTIHPILPFFFPFRCINTKNLQCFSFLPRVVALFLFFSFPLTFDSKRTS